MRSPAQNSPTLRHRFEAALTELAAALFKRLGPDRASALGGWIGRTVGPRLTPISSRAHRNLSAALPELSEAEVRRITREVWDNLGRTAAEYSHLEAFRLSHPEGRVTASGLEHLRGAIASGRPAIFVSGHFANWEVMSTVLFEEGLSYCLVYRRANNPLVDAAVQRWRSGLMSDQLAPKGKEGAKVILAALKAGQSLAMLVDQKMNDGIAAPFFGREAMTAPAAARLSLRFGAPIIPMAVTRDGGARLHVTISPPLAFQPTGDQSADILALTTRINAFLEAQIRANPGQWLWLHNRWPKGAR